MGGSFYKCLKMDGGGKPTGCRGFMAPPDGATAMIRGRTGTPANAYRRRNVDCVRERASLLIPSDPFLPMFPLMWRGVRGSSYRGGVLPLLALSRNDNTTSPLTPYMYVVCVYVWLSYPDLLSS